MSISDVLARLHYMESHLLRKLSELAREFELLRLNTAHSKVVNSEVPPKMSSDYFIQSNGSNGQLSTCASAMCSGVLGCYASIDHRDMSTEPYVFISSVPGLITQSSSFIIFPIALCSNFCFPYHNAFLIRCPQSHLDRRPLE